MLCTTISFVEMHDVVVCYAGRTAANITVLGLLNSFYDIFRTCMSFIEPFVITTMVQDQEPDSATLV